MKKRLIWFHLAVLLGVLTPLVATPDEPPTRTFYLVELRSFHPGDTVRFLASVRQVREGARRGVSGETVTFSLSPDDGTASLSITSGTTNSNGDVRTTLTLSSSASGNYRVTATFGDGTSKSHGITVYNSSIPPSEFIISMVYSSLPINPGESITFTCIVEKNASPVQGQTVTFSVSPNDGTVSLSTTSATSDSDGKARTTLSTGSNSSGSYTVTASLGGQSISGTATVETSPPQDDQQSISGTATVETSPPQDDSGEDQQESEEQPTPTVELDGISTSHDSVREDDGSVTIALTVTLDKTARAGGETVTLAIVSPTQGKTAKRGEDFDATLDETITIPKGTIKGPTAQLILTPKDNTTADGDKAFAVEATSSSGHRALINIKIIDDEMAGEADGEANGEADDEADGETDGEMDFAFAGEVEDQVYTAGTAITAIVLPEATGGEGEVTYRVFYLPAGLVFDAATRTISGTPEAATDGAVEVTCLAQDDVDATAMLTFSITVNPPLSFGDLFGGGAAGKAN